MSKYKARGCYHYAEFAKNTPYRHHVLDLLEKVSERVSLDRVGDGIQPRLIDIGCGEGLIMSEFTKKGFLCHGLEIDPVAVKLGRERGNTIMHTHGEDLLFAEKTEFYDVALLCDVLEHTKDPIRMMAIVKQLANYVVIATPDREDKHAEHEVKPDAIMSYFTGWELLHCRQRHARWLMIFKKIR